MFLRSCCKRVLPCCYSKNEYNGIGMLDRDESYANQKRYFEVMKKKNNKARLLTDDEELDPKSTEVPNSNEESTPYDIKLDKQSRLEIQKGDIENSHYLSPKNYINQTIDFANLVQKENDANQTV